MENNIDLNQEISFETFKKQVLEDYRLIVTSREASLLGRREVLNGKAKFGIFGDGKELPQIALSKVFQKGDYRSGYYRDQTFMISIKELTVKQLFQAYMLILISTKNPCQLADKWEPILTLLFLTKMVHGKT